jgi:putative transposase
VWAHKFELIDFVIMPDHFHLLIKLDGSMSIEKAMQLIKGRFSYRLKRETGYAGEVWQHGFSEVRVGDERSRPQYRRYIAENPLKAGLCEAPEEYPYCFSYLAKKKSEQRLKPSSFSDGCGTPKTVP